MITEIARSIVCGALKRKPRSGGDSRAREHLATESRGGGTGCQTCAHSVRLETRTIVRAHVDRCPTSTITGLARDAEIE